MIYHGGYLEDSNFLCEQSVPSVIGLAGSFLYASISGATTIFHVSGLRWRSNRGEASRLCLSSMILCVDEPLSQGQCR